MILSRVSLRSMCLHYLSLWSEFRYGVISLWGDDADFSADVVGASDLTRPLHGARRSGFDLLFHLLGGDHIDGRALLHVFAGRDEQAGQLRLRDGHRHPGNANDEVSHALPF